MGKIRGPNMLSEHRLIPEWIEVADTMRLYGIDPRLLRPSSAKLVVAVCVVCGGKRTKPFRHAASQPKCLNCSNRINSVASIPKRSENLKRTFAVRGHPRKGIKHTAESKAKMSAWQLGRKIVLSPEAKAFSSARCRRVLLHPDVVAKTIAINRARRGPLSASYGRPPKHAKKIWGVTPSGEAVCFRSTWEAAYANWLTSQGKQWEYEPRQFPVEYEIDGVLFSGTYTPDFLVDGEWKEVKGRWLVEAMAKFEAFKRTYPAESIEVIDRVWLTKTGILPK